MSPDGLIDVFAFFDETIFVRFLCVRSMSIPTSIEKLEYCWSTGFWSKSSIWLGAAAMWRKMIRFALGAKDGAIVLSRIIQFI